MRKTTCDKAAVRERWKKIWRDFLRGGRRKTHPSVLEEEPGVSTGEYSRGSLVRDGHSYRTTAQGLKDEPEGTGDGGGGSRMTNRVGDLVHGQKALLQGKETTRAVGEETGTWFWQKGGKKRGIACPDGGKDASAKKPAPATKLGDYMGGIRPVYGARGGKQSESYYPLGAERKKVSQLRFLIVAAIWARGGGGGLGGEGLGEGGGWGGGGSGKVGAGGGRIGGTNL